MKNLYIVFSLLMIQNFVFASSHVSTSKSKKHQRKGPKPIVLKPVSCDLVRESDLKHENEILEEARKRTYECNQSLYCMKRFDRPHVRLGATGLPESAIDIPYIQNKVIPWLNYVFASPVAQSLYVKDGIFQEQAFHKDVGNAAIVVSRTQMLIGKEIHSAPFIKSQAPRFFASRAEQLARRCARKEAREVEDHSAEFEDAATIARRKFFETD